MSFWLLGLAILQVGIIVCAWSGLRGDLLQLIVAMELAASLTILSVVLLAESMGRPAWLDLAIAMALLSFPGGMVFIVLMENWL